MSPLIPFHSSLSTVDFTFASVWLGDIDGDDTLDLVTTASAYQASGAAVVQRFVLAGTSVPNRLSWGGYLGTKGTGALDETSPDSKN